MGMRRWAMAFATLGKGWRWGAVLGFLGIVLILLANLLPVTAAETPPARIKVLIVTGQDYPGHVWRETAPVLRRLYDQMPEPKYVIAMGDCAACGGVFNNYAIVQGVDEIVPVDVYVAGCPPRPEALIDGILKLQEKIMRSHPLKETSKANA